jgi:hypothetical protein
MLNQKQQENVEYFNYLSSVLIVMQDARVKLNPGLSWQEQHSTGRFFSQAHWNKLRKQLIEVLHLEHSIVWCFGKSIKNTWKALKCGAE